MGRWGDGEMGRRREEEKRRRGDGEKKRKGYIGNLFPAVIRIIYAEHGTVKNKP